MKLCICFFLIVIAAGFGQNKDARLWNESMEPGSKVYSKHCVVCHKKDGTGKGNRIPPLARSDFLMNNLEESIRGIKYGQEGKITVNEIVYDRVMKPQKLNNKEIADVMNYILNSWGNTSDILVTPEKVGAILE